MWKSVLAIVVLLTIGLPVYRQQERGNPSTNQNDGKPAQPPPPPTAGVATCVIKQDGTTIECYYPQANPRSYLSRLGSPENFPNLALAAIGLLGIVVAICTLIKIERQTKAAQATAIAAKASAKAALEQIELMKDKERARLSLEITDYTFTPLPIVRFDLVCDGTTPATILSTWESTQLNQFPDVIPWVKEALGFPLGDIPSVVRSGTINSFVFISSAGDSNPDPDETRTAIEEGKFYIHFRVRIVYRDIFGSEWPLEVSKIFGIRSPSKEHGGVDPAIISSGLPQWHDSKHKYGDESEG
jgi:hypothetical protein